MPKETIMSKISDEEFEKIVNSSNSYREIADKCGYCNYSGASLAIVKRRIKQQNLDFENKFVNRVYREDEEIFITGSPVNQATLRRRYFQGKFTEYKCAICGQEPFWNGKKLVLTLDHINGKNHDDRLENLRWICPNCDRQLDTFAGRNIVRESDKNYCVDCGKEILQSSTRCQSCASIYKGKLNRKVERPEREELKSKIRIKSFCEIAREYNVTDNAIRKWCVAYNLPKTKKAISEYADSEWENL